MTHSQGGMLLMMMMAASLCGRWGALATNGAGGMMSHVPPDLRFRRPGPLFQRHSRKEAARLDRPSRRTPLGASDFHIRGLPPGEVRPWRPTSQSSRSSSSKFRAKFSAWSEVQRKFGASSAQVQRKFSAQPKVPRKFSASSAHALNFHRKP